MPSFLVVTTRDLPEAHYLGRYLDSHRQQVSFVNLIGRPPLRSVRVVSRLARSRGVPYVTDFLLGRLLARHWVAPGPSAFPEIDAAAIEADRARWPRIEATDPHGPPVLAFVERAAPDWILLAGVPVLRPAFYGLARQGALNRHLGVLPHYRGSDCPIWTLAEGRPEDVGFSIHFVSQKVDGGDVITHERVPPQPALTLSAFLARLQRCASEGFVRVLEQAIQGAELPRQPQSAAAGVRYPPAGLTAVRRAARTWARLAADSPRVPARAA
ncbi:MAG: formyltransferase family protein [Candidatus Rokuibacteriota bacterium]